MYIYSIYKNKINDDDDDDDDDREKRDDDVWKNEYI